MEVAFRTNKLAKLCSEAKKMVRAWGKECADRVQQRLAELEAADTLADLRALPGVGCHELTGNRKGQLALDAKHPYRLIIEPDHDPLPEVPDGGLDWSQVQRVIVIEVVDYH